MAGNTPDRKLASVTIDGVEMRCRDAQWVVYNPKGEPVGAFPSDFNLRDHVDKAARSYWYGDKPAILALNQGYRLQLMSNVDFYKNVAAHLKYEN